MVDITQERCPCRIDCNIPLFSFSPQSSSMQHPRATNLTKVSD